MHKFLSKRNFSLFFVLSCVFYEIEENKIKEKKSHLLKLQSLFLQPLLVPLLQHTLGWTTFNSQVFPKTFIFNIAVSSFQNNISFLFVSCVFWIMKLKKKYIKLLFNFLKTQSKYPTKSYQIRCFCLCFISQDDEPKHEFICLCKLKLPLNIPLRNEEKLLGNYGMIQQFVATHLQPSNMQQLRRSSTDTNGINVTHYISRDFYSESYFTPFLSIYWYQNEAKH